MFDILFVLLVAPFVLPVVGLLALLVRLDGGPAFYTQDRVGFGGRRFKMYKLRTMVPDAEARLAEHLARDWRAAAEWDLTQKLSDDPRITRIGAVLRCTSLDELPQFFNVLVGDMSIVGPRPFTLAQEATYRATGGTAYFGLRPGLTGPWQVSDRHRSRFIDRKAHDDAYAETQSLSVDLRLIARTVTTMISRSGR
ncbi:sugar transferase [Histidinibacterium lentulum]|uniref:Sugar transferase n=2 Tax=Histidinibacterium lentulum TaxID=2480588 RepID=A0A3N2QRZ7_9RHOB|nr:sugar transferase [Histidinibacterium lentulum]